jgi:hypothetical protein
MDIERYRSTTSNERKWETWLFTTKKQTIFNTYVNVLSGLMRKRVILNKGTTLKKHNLDCAAFFYKLKEIWGLLDKTNSIKTVFKVCMGLPNNEMRYLTLTVTPKLEWV